MKFPFNVVHDSKGSGKALNIVCRGDDRYIIIDFGNRKEEFLYPDQFVFHIKALDPQIQKEILAGIGSPNTSPSNRMLTEGIVIAKKGINVYDICCKYFGWDKSKRRYFGPQGIMYAKNATPEKYSVWMIVHNSLVEPFHNGTSGWYNVVKSDTIEEIWYTDSRGSADVSDISIRVTFLKTREGYMFKGIYKLSDAELREINGTHRIVKIYKMISNKYPARPEWM